MAELFDYNDPAIAANLPSYLSQTAYSQAGGTAGGYASWVSNQIQKGMQNAMYSQYDPRYFQGATQFDSPVIGQDHSFERDKLAQEQAGGGGGGGGGGTPPASPPATTALTRSLKNRKPGLAGGFSGWSGDQKGQGNSNFNYFSRFA